MMSLPGCSPLEVKIGSEAGPQNVRAWGPGLETGIMGKSADFVVEAVGDNVGTLGKYTHTHTHTHTDPVCPGQKVCVLIRRCVS